MVYDINADLVREKYIIPNCRKFANFVDRKTHRRLYEAFAERMGAVFRIQLSSERDKERMRARRHMPDRSDAQPQIALQFSGEMRPFYENIRKIAGFDWERTSKEVNSGQREDRRFTAMLEEKLKEHLPLECKISVEENKMKITF